jgi:hypothetical protein
MNHLLLVCGPGGSGKSTFIEQFRSGRLRPELRELLPAGAETWPHMGSDRSERGLRTLEETENLILHYDIAARPRRQESHVDDPVLAGLLSAKQLTIVDIRPSRECLLTQLSSRAAEAEARRGILSRLWRSAGLHDARHFRKMRRRRGLRTKASLYREERWLETLYARWDGFLQATLAGRGEGFIVRVEPGPDEVGNPSFRVVGNGKASVPLATVEHEGEQPVRG